MPGVLTLDWAYPARHHGLDCLPTPVDVEHARSIERLRVAGPVVRIEPDPEMPCFDYEAEAHPSPYARAADRVAAALLGKDVTIYWEGNCCDMSSPSEEGRLSSMYHDQATAILDLADPEAERDETWNAAHVALVEALVDAFLDGRSAERRGEGLGDVNCVVDTTTTDAG